MKSKVYFIISGIFLILYGAFLLASIYTDIKAFKVIAAVAMILSGISTIFGVQRKNKEK